MIVLGQFLESASSTLISAELVRLTLARPVEEQVARPVRGYDHAEGGDRCALAKRRGAAQLEPVKAWREKDPQKSCEIIANEFESTPREFRPSRINVDASVIGAEAVRRLRKLRVPNVHAVLIGLPASNKRYADVRTWLAFRAREWMREGGRLHEDDRDLQSEMTGQTYARTAANKLKLSVKEDDFEVSPDIWDAGMMIFAVDKMALSEVDQAA